ncbi:MAG: sigma-70 family RNA polymerase sigma factor [Bacteroidota bacterium]
MSKANYTRTKAEILEENQLVQAAKKQPRKFAALYTRYYETIFRFVFKRVSDNDLSADITQQVFMKAMENLKRYEFRGLPFSAWLYQIARNEVAQFFRQNKHQRSISMESGQIAYLMEEMEETNSDADVQRMVKAIQLLRQEEIEFIEMKYFERLPYREIAAIYQIQENNAKVKMHRLLKKLKKLMAQPEFQEKNI